MEPHTETPRLLDVIDIAEPCQVPWDSMTGDERIRFCGMCKKSVYNISEMTSSEAENFLRANLGSACFGFNRRADGTIVTDDCPKFLKPVRDGVRRLSKTVAILLGTVMSASAAFAQGDGSSQYTKEQNAALAAGRFRERRGPARFGGAPNVWRGEAPLIPTISLQELTTGEFALTESEVYVQAGKTYISEELNTQRFEKQPKQPRREGACIDGCTASGAFQRGKEWVAGHNDRIAESYFKLALTLSKPPHLYTEFETQEILNQYCALLRRNGRAQLADVLSKNGVAPERKKMWEKAHALLGLDPATLAPRPQAKTPKRRK